VYLSTELHGVIPERHNVNIFCREKLKFYKIRSFTVVNNVGYGNL